MAARQGKTRSQGKARSAKKAQPAAGDYAREALSQWGTAARLGLASLAPGAKTAASAASQTVGRLGGNGSDRPPLRERLNPAKTEKGGRIGTAADKLLAKMGPPGKLASKVALGSRLTERLGAGDEDAGDLEGSDGGITVPIQESMEVAVPVALAFRLCMRFEEYPGFLERVEAVEPEDDARLEFVAKVRGRSQTLPIEVFDVRPNERIDWRSTDGLEHSGSITFHELAPRLTHIELSVDAEPHGVIGRIARSTGLSDRVVRAEMHRFKAYAELYEDEGEEEGQEPEEPEEEEEPEAEEQGEEPEAEEAEDDEEVPAEVS